jgi:tryptophanyl-tRNA synthetase
MSKSGPTPAGLINLLDDPKVSAKKIRSAVTDSETEVRFDPAAKPGISNLLQILAATTGAAIPDLEREYATTGYGRLKTAVAESVVEFLRPLQERYATLAADPAEVDAQLAVGAEKAEAIATKVLERVRRATGLLLRSR